MEANKYSRFPVNDNAKDGNQNGVELTQHLYANEKTILLPSDAEMSSPDAEYPNTAEVDRSLYMDNTTNWLSSLMNIVKGNLGIGLLSLPFAMMNAGIVVGPVLFVIIAIITIHCMHMMVQCGHALCDRTKSNLYLGYADVAKMSIAQYYPNKDYLGRLLVNTFLFITQLGFCCVYILFTAETLQQIFNEQVHLDVKVWVAIILIPLILLSFIRTLAVLSMLSAIANFIYFAGTVCLLVYAGQTAQSPANLPHFAGFASIPLTMGIIMFAFEGIGVILPIENMMALPRYFISVLNLGMGLVFLIDLLISLLGYLSCGNRCPGSFTLSLPDTPYYAAIKMTFAIAIIFTYFIQFYVAMSIIIPPAQKKVADKYRLLVDLGIRTLSVCITGALAIGIPLLGDMVSLVGSVGSTALAITFPAVIHILTFQYDKSLSAVSLIKDLVLVLLGVVITVSGLYTSIVNIIWNLEHPLTAHGASNSTQT